MSEARDGVRGTLARAIARGLGDDFDHAFVTKAEWTQARGEKGGRARDINEPMQSDYLDAAYTAIAAAEQAGWKLVPASEHDRLSDRVASLDEPYVDDRGEHWRAPTAHAYAAVCKALRTCKAERDAARAAAPKVTP